MTKDTGGPIVNTDRELWRGPDEGCGDFYADSIHVTENGGIGINCGGTVIVKPLRDWHKFAINALSVDGEYVVVPRSLLELPLKTLRGSTDILDHVSLAVPNEWLGRIRDTLTAPPSPVRVDEGTVERVARAICRSWESYCDLDKPDGIAQWRANKTKYMFEARAAIEAMEKKP